MFVIISMAFPRTRESDHQGIYRHLLQEGLEANEGLAPQSHSATDLAPLDGP